MSKRIRIAVDAMSGDLGPRIVISAVEKFVSLHPHVDFTLIGDKIQLQPLLAKSRAPSDNVYVEHAPDVIYMTDNPVHVMRQKKNSSMWVALDYLRSGQADACVSAGNTGALLAIAKHLIKTFPSIDRPAICKSMPVAKGITYLLDLGANINCSPSHLHQFALMGSSLAESVGVDAARVALLNIGSESPKGTDLLQQAKHLLEHDQHINYVGFIEPNEIFTGNADVIVCDGFHGNIALKASEGAARFISQKILSAFQRNTVNKLLSVIAAPLIKQLQEELDPSLYNGAFFLGLKKVVVKSHGGANDKAFLQALLVAKDQVLLPIPDLISTPLTSKN